MPVAVPEEDSEAEVKVDSRQDLPFSSSSFGAFPHELLALHDPSGLEEPIACSACCGPLLPSASCRPWSEKPKERFLCERCPVGVNTVTMK